MRLGQGLTVPRRADCQSNRKAQVRIRYSEISSNLIAAVCRDEIAVLACDQVISAAFGSGNHRAVLCRNGDHDITCVFRLGDFKGDRIGRKLDKVDRQCLVLRQCDRLLYRLVAVFGNAIGIGTLAEVINAVRRGLLHTA